MSTDSPKGDTEFSLDKSPSHLLHRAQQFAAEAFDEGNKTGLTLRQFAVLAAVSEREGCIQSDLVETTGIDRSTLADMVQRMERKSLIRRERAKLDARAKSVHLTDEGRTALEEALPLIKASDEAILALLPKSRRRSFIGILGLLAYAGDIEETNVDVPADVKKKKAPVDKDEDKKKKRKKKKKKDKS